MAELLDDMHTITCPTMLHFGDADPYINHLAPHFSQPEAARKARTETAMFLFTHLGPNGAGA